MGERQPGLAREIGPRLARDGDRIDPLGVAASSFAHQPSASSGKSGPVLDATEALLLDAGDEVTVGDGGGRRVGVVGGEAEDADHERGSCAKPPLGERHGDQPLGDRPLAGVDQTGAAVEQPALHHQAPERHEPGGDPAELADAVGGGEGAGRGGEELLGLLRRRTSPVRPASAPAACGRRAESAPASRSTRAVDRQALGMPVGDEARAPRAGKDDARRIERRRAAAAPAMQ